MFSLVILVRGVGGKLFRLVYLAPRPGFGSGSVVSQFLLHHYLGIFSCKRYKHYFSQTEMFTSNVQFGYPCQRGGGQAVQAGLSCPPPGFESGIVISQFLLHHNLGKFSCKSCEHYFSQTEMFTSNVQFCYPCPRGGGQAVQAGLSCPPAQDIVISQFLLHNNLGIFSCKCCEHNFSQTEMFTSNGQFVYPCPRGGGQAFQAGLLKFWAGGGAR